MCACPASGTSARRVTIGMRFLSAMTKMCLTWLVAVIGELTSTDTGTTAPFSAMSGISSFTALLPSLIGRLSKTRFIAASTVSWRPSAWACAGPGTASVPVTAAAPSSPTVPSIERRVMARSVVMLSSLLRAPLRRPRHILYPSAS